MMPEFLDDPLSNELIRVLVDDILKLLSGFEKVCGQLRIRSKPPAIYKKIMVRSPRMKS